MVRAKIRDKIFFIIQAYREKKSLKNLAHSIKAVLCINKQASLLTLSLINAS
jgi:hypothetical protein